MCTAATYQTKDFYFGRTLDYEFSYGDEIVVTPRKFPLDFCHMGKCDAHYGMIGMAHVADGYPLYYDAVNEKGVGMAGLNFVGWVILGQKLSARELLGCALVFAVVICVQLPDKKKTKQVETA